MRVVCISDTHERHRQLVVPAGDLLVCAGDVTGRGHPDALRDVVAWLAELPHHHRVLIAGNHDFCFEREAALCRAILRDTGIIYLEDAGVEIEGLHVWGSPWQPEFMDWAFNLPRGPLLAERWALIPDQTDILVTHGPPFGILDRTPRGTRAGCDDLLAALPRIRPRLHVFGHIHDSYGTVTRAGTIHVNACACDERYRPVNAPIVVDL